MFRTLATPWFELLCARDESIRLVALLARTGMVEIETDPLHVEGLSLERLGEGLARYQELSARYQRYWKRQPAREAMLSAAPESLLRHALALIDAWRREADPVIEAVQRLEDERSRLRTLSGILGQMASSSLNFNLVFTAGPILEFFCVLLPAEADLELPDWVVFRSVPQMAERCFGILGPRDRLGPLKRQIEALKGHVLQRPEWLRGDPPEARRLVLTRLQELDGLITDHYRHIAALCREFTLDQACGNLACLDWFARHVGGLERAGRHFVRVSGWTSDLNGRRLPATLERAGSPALLRFVDPPPGISPPQLLYNPAWIKPFELFARAVGTPGRDEADPTPLLALVVPLLFGYMFGDVGQGAVLIGVGYWLSSRLTAGRIVMAGGISAMLFGFLFGSLFGRHDLIPALWVHPLDSPLPVLLMPLLFGVLLLTTGELFSALAARWGNRLLRWLAGEGGLLLLYLGLVGLMLTPLAGWVAATGLAWYILAALWRAPRPLPFFAALGQLIENGFRLLTSTLSFARVGAFALAHASLSLAISSMADACASPLAAAAVMIGGNLLVIGLEGLVVSIQTSRLILFEFFGRFLEARGRRFQPLTMPPVALGEGK